MRLNGVHRLIDCPLDYENVACNRKNALSPYLLCTFCQKKKKTVMIVRKLDNDSNPENEMTSFGIEVNDYYYYQ